MTCQRCSYGWCWLCGKKYSSWHYNPVNVFGCPGQQYFTYNRFWVIILNIGLLFLMPLVLFFGPPIALTLFFFDKCYTRYGCLSCFVRNKFLSILGILLFAPIVLAVGFVLGALTLGILIVPALLFQLYRLMQLLFYRCRCCLK